MKDPQKAIYQGEPNGNDSIHAAINETLNKQFQMKHGSLTFQLLSLESKNNDVFARENNRFPLASVVYIYGIIWKVVPAVLDRLLSNVCASYHP